MAESGLGTELRRRAEAHAESILAKAREEAERVSLETERIVEERRRRALSDRELGYRAEARTAMAASRHQAMRDVLVARTNAVGRVVDRIRSLLPEAMRAEPYVAGLADELRAALRFVDGENATVRCSPDLESNVRTVLRDRPGVAVEPGADIGSGFTVIGSRGSVLVDGRLDTRLDRLASSLAIEINEKLEERLR